MRRGMQVWHFPGGFFIAESAEITFCMFPAVRSQPQTIPEFYFASPLAEGWSDMKKDLFALKGTICYSKNQKELVFAENSYAVCENGLCAGVFFPASREI